MVDKDEGYKPTKPCSFRMITSFLHRAVIMLSFSAVLCRKGETTAYVLSSRFLQTSRVASSGNSTIGNSKHKHNDSWSHLVSSRELYAQMLNRTVQEVEREEKMRKEEVKELRVAIQTTTDPRKRQALIGRHRLRHGKHPFACRKCWSYLPICLCRDSSNHNVLSSDDGSTTTESNPPLHLTPVLRSQHLDLPCRSVVVWTHDSEWGSPSNTGSTLPLVLYDTHVLMKGLHEAELNALMTNGTNDDAIPIVLWPDRRQDPNMSSNQPPPQQEPIYVTREDLQGLESRVVLIVVEGTWQQARKMVRQLPFPRYSLKVPLLASALDANTLVRQEPSLIAPLRKTKERDQFGLCTAEAVAAALESLGLSTEDASYIRQVAREKVERTRRYQGKPPMVMSDVVQ